MDIRAERALAELAVELSDGATVHHSIDQVVKFAIETIGSPHAGVTLIHKNGRFETLSSSTPVVVQADDLQHALREGPCVDASLEAKTVVSADLGHDQRWPTWGPQVAQMGLGSVLSTKLYAGGQRIGALNLYGSSGRTFSDKDVETAHIFTQHASAAIAAASGDAQLRKALDTRTIVGQAQGILMERYRIDADRAFAVLRRHSQDRNIKLHEVALHVTLRHQLPLTRADVND